VTRRRTFFNRPEDASTVILPPFPKKQKDDDTTATEVEEEEEEEEEVDRSSPEYEARLVARQEKIRIYRDKLMKYNWKELRGICGSKKIKMGKAKQPMIERLLRFYRKQLVITEKQEREKQKQNDKHSNSTQQEHSISSEEYVDEYDDYDDDEEIAAGDKNSSGSHSSQDQKDEAAEIEAWVTRYVQRIRQYDWKTLKSMCQILALPRSTVRDPTISRLAEHFRQRIIQEGLDGPTIRKERMKQKHSFIIPKEMSTTTTITTKSATTELYPNIKKVVQSFHEFKGRNQSRSRTIPKRPR
jgi:hypothetical protein